MAEWVALSSAVKERILFLPLRLLALALALAGGVPDVLPDAAGMFISVNGVEPHMDRRAGKQDAE